MQEIKKDIVNDKWVIIWKYLIRMCLSNNIASRYKKQKLT